MCSPGGVTGGRAVGPARRHRYPGAVVAGMLVVAVLAAGCSEGSDRPQAQHSTGSPSTPASSSASPTPTPTSLVPSYTPPASRVVPRPTAVATLPPDTCALASTAGQAVISGWESGPVSYVREGEKVPDSQWAELVQILPSPSLFNGLTTTRTRLNQAGVPPTHVVNQDLADLEAAMRAAIAVAKAKDDSRVIPVYFQLRTAHDRFTESCGVLEH